MASPRDGFFRRLTHDLWRAVADTAEARTVRAANRLRSLPRDIIHGRFTCSCCPGKEFRGVRALNAHHLARHGNYWGGKAARATGRKMGKAQDAARRHARGWREASGLIDNRGRTTDRGRSRPDHQGRLSLRHLREKHRHDRDHERADGHARKAAARQARADRHGARAEAREARGRSRGLAGRLHARHAARAERSQARAEGLRGRWPQRDPQAAPPRPAPSPAGNGSRPSREDIDRAVRELLERTARPAPEPVPARAHRLAPEPAGRAGRTR